MASVNNPLDRLRRDFRLGPFPRRVDADAAMHGGCGDSPGARQVIAYVRHHYSNYERVLKRIPHSQVDCFEFKTWVNCQIEQKLTNRETNKHRG